MSDLALIGIVFAGGISAVLGAALVCGVIWIIADHCEDFSKNPFDEARKELNRKARNG